MHLKVRLSGISGCVGRAGSMPQLAGRLLYAVENWEKKHERGLCSFTRLWDLSQSLRKVTAEHLWFSKDMVSSSLAPFQMYAVKKVWGNVRADRMASENPSVSVTDAYYCRETFLSKPMACSLCVQATLELIPPGPFTLSRVVCH